MRAFFDGLLGAGAWVSDVSVSSFSDSDVSTVGREMPFHSDSSELLCLDRLLELLSESVEVSLRLRFGSLTKDGGRESESESLWPRLTRLKAVRVRLPIRRKLLPF